MGHPADHASGTATAAGVRARLELLFAARREALEAGLETHRVFMQSVEEDIEASRAAYVGLAVTEIATLRGELGGRDLG